MGSRNSKPKAEGDPPSHGLSGAAGFPLDEEPESWPHGLRVLLVVMQVCEMVHEISERLRLRNAPELKGYADNIKRLIYQWRDSDFHFLQGTQVSRMASALQVFDAELQRVHAKIKGQQNNSLMVSKRRLEASLQRSLLKVNRAYIEFQKAVEALVKEGSRGRTAPSKGPGAIPSPAHDSGSFSGESEFGAEDDDTWEGGQGGVSKSPSSPDHRRRSVSSKKGDGDLGLSSAPPSPSASMIAHESMLEGHDRGAGEVAEASGLSSIPRGPPSSGSLVSDDLQDVDSLGVPELFREGCESRSPEGFQPPPACSLEMSTTTSHHGHDRKASQSQQQGGLLGITGKSFCGAQATSCFVEGPGLVALQDPYLQKLVALADSGNLDATFELGKLCRDGQVFEYEPILALEYFYMAAERGHLEACYQVGCMNASGEGLAAPDLQEAVAWYRKAACWGHSEAAAAFGQALELGMAVNENLRAAAAWYRRAALSGSARGANNLGKLFFDGRGVSKDLTKAVAWFKYAVKSRGEPCPSAMNNLGICYEDGLGVQADKDAALGCYQRAADHGHLGAMLNLAYLHFSRGNIPAARMSFESAASQGSAEAMYSLACIVERQATISKAGAAASLADVQEDLDEGGHALNRGAAAASARATEAHFNAEQLYRKAAEAGDPRAQHRLAAWYWDEGFVDEALVMFHTAAAQEHAASLNALGIIAEEGQNGCQKDLKMAWECYRLAALHGSIEAEKNLRAVEEVLESEEVQHALEREGFRLGVTGFSDLALQDISPDNMQRLQRSRRGRTTPTDPSERTASQKKRASPAVGGHTSSDLTGYQENTDAEHRQSPSGYRLPIRLEFSSPLLRR